MASGQRVKRSMQVSRYTYPLEGGRGSTRSMWMWSGSGFHLRSQLLQISHRHSSISWGGMTTFDVKLRSDHRNLVNALQALGWVISVRYATHDHTLRHRV